MLPPTIRPLFFAFAALGPCAVSPTQAIGSPVARDGLAADQRPDEAAALLQRLTLEEKAGQLFVIWSLSRADDAGRAQVVQRVRELELGGVVLSLGTAEQAAAYVAELQAAATVPLLLAGDFECGLGFRLEGASPMGNQMLVGATGSTRLARRVGEVTGIEAKALGFHHVYAPVLDVNSNPQNPIINVRSFGEDPQLVARLGTALCAGIRSAGLIPCGKHFPGHGDVQTDSHLELPTVPGDGERLRSVELVPFRAACQGGLESIMTGHLSVPGLGERAGVPATLSRTILQDVLRGELGFEGLVVTDALEMGGVKTDQPREQIAVRALLAGCDVLLMPPDPRAARDAIVAAVREGTVPLARLDEAVLRILRAKERVGLLASGGRLDPDWRRAVGSFGAVGEEIAARGITLVTDRQGLVPLRGFGDAVLVTLQDAPEAAASEAFDVPHRAHVELSPKSSAAEIEQAIGLVAAADRVLLALHVRVREYSGAIGLPPALRPLVKALRPEQQVVAVAFGNPYLGAQLPEVDAYLCAYGSSALVERAAARALRGAERITGRLPVSIPGLAAAGDGHTRLPGRDVPRAQPTAEDVAQDLGAKVRGLLEGAVADRAFPGAVCLVARRGVVVAEVAVGHATYDADAAPVTLDTRYDLASLTKVCATTPAVLRLCAEGRLSLDDPVQRWVPGFVGKDKERVTVRHLLAHTSGLPAYERFWRTLRGKEAIVAAAARADLATEPGAKFTYSDLGMILSMAVVESASGEPFADYVHREVFLPLGMRSAGFATDRGAAVEAPPTEVDEARGLVQGRVHDENAFAMGGVSGHAGLFATAEDVLRIGLCWLGGGRGVLPAPLVDLATRPATEVGAVTRGLGLELLRSGGYGGTAVPAGAFGHTGFTGTSLWCDPGSDVCVVLLTNRVHPTRDNQQIGAVRRRLHDLVLASVER